MNVAWLRADVSADRAALDKQFSGQLDELAAWCDANDLQAEATRVRGWALPRALYTTALAALPPTIEAVLPADANDSTREFRRRFEDLRNGQAAALMSLANQAVAERRLSLAYELVAAAGRENPSDANPRRILGYELHDGRWMTPYEIRKLAARQVWDDRFGWIPRDRLQRYERGERNYRGAWMSAADEARRVTSIDKGWEIVTEHYSIRTNHSLEEGVRLASQLETLYRAWWQLFVLYHASESEIAGWIRGAAPRPPAPQRHNVVYFRNRDEYNAALIQSQPNIGVSTGYYDPAARIAYFFAGLEGDKTLYHEATHQLFAEVRSSRRAFGDVHNFWIVEGIACYMETFTPCDGYCLLGGADAERLLAARYRVLSDDFYVPLAELVQLNLQRLQSDPRIAKLYSESAGLTHFLMHANQGRYRDVVDDYLLAIYTGRDRIGTLSELAGVSFETLDREYRTFLQTLSSSPAAE
ncbi:MAG TPA: hypothetical protein VG713_07860 [Pirellulales bacterium]|nr:hypothetical protein [Pirellulales bacterium]